MKQEREWELCLADQEKPVQFRWELVASWPDMPSSRGRGKLKPREVLQKTGSHCLLLPALG